MTARRVVPFVLLAVAAWVNYPHLAGWLGDPGQAPAGPMADPDQPFDDREPVPAPPGPEAAPMFRPVVVTTDLVDPFRRDVAPAQPTAELANKLLPEVTLILATASSRRALVDGCTVGVGDAIAIGRVEAIGAREVTVRTHAGAVLRLPLASRPARVEQASTTPGSPQELNAEENR